LQETNAILSGIKHASLLEASVYACAEVSFPAMKITEPATMITDYMLALACAVFAILTLRLQTPHRAVPIWFLAFLTGSVAALLGGTFHGFKLYFSAGRGKGIWDFTMILIGASAAFMIAGALISSIGRGDLESVKWIRRGLIVSAAGFVIQKIGWDPHQHLNHNDIYHLIQIAGFWCLYEGVHQLGN